MLTLLAGAIVRADVTLAPLFVDGAVVQRDKPLPIWGRANAGEKITVTFAGQIRNLTVGRDGRWMVMFDALPANSTGTELTAKGRNSVTIRDVVVGEVWLCAGTSNMEWPVNRSADAERETASANFPLIRHITISQAAAAQPAESAGTSGWKPATAEHVGSFSAIGYFFAREIHRKTGVPVGIVSSTWSGTRIETWLQPEAPGIAAADSSARGGIFNGMISPLVPYALRGILWYQGESNTDQPRTYGPLFRALITSWRTHFRQGDIPFYWVNLAGLEAPADPTGRNYAFLREAQTQALVLPNTGQAVAIDLGDPKDMHPTNKQDVARRLALLAKNRVYDITGDDAGPMYKGVTRERAGLRVHFTNATGGLIAREKPPEALEVAGADRVFRRAVGRIERDTLVVSSTMVREPVAVRYAWTNAPEANLYNGAGLPVVPFRSDDW